MSTGCPDEATVLAFIAGRLPDGERAAAEAHLAKCDACADLATWAAADVAASARPPGSEGRPFMGQLAPGSRVDRYQILAPIGRGGMGEVYAAYHPDLDRRIALKIVHELGSAESSRQSHLLREARMVARLSHPNIVTVHDAGTINGRVYVAMEFVDGQTIDAWLRDGPRSWSEILGVFVAAGRGLAAAHEAKIVHRDFKPQNVMIARDGSVKVMDFGLARPFREADQPRGAAEPTGASTIDIATVTRDGVLLGTPAYMAPEQLRGERTDARADQFSFCVALYEALYGERPCAGGKIQELTDNAEQANVRRTPARTQVPPWVRNALLRGLRPVAAERYPSLSDLLKALAKDPRARTRRILLGAAAVLLPIAFGLGVRQRLVDHRAVCNKGAEKLAGIWELPGTAGVEGPRQAQIHRAFLQTDKSYAPDVFATVSHALTDYAQSWANAYRETCEATQVRHDQSADVLDLRMSCLQDRLGGLQALTEVFAGANGEVVANAVYASNALASPDRCADVPRLRAIGPPESPEIRARVTSYRTRLAGIKARLNAGKWKEALQDGPKLVAEIRTAGYQPLLAEALTVMGRIYLEAADYKEGERSLVEAFVAADASRHDEVRAVAAEALFYVLGYQQGRFEEARHWYEIAAAIISRLGGHELLQAWLLNDSSSVLDLQDRYDEGAEAAARSMDLKQKVLGANHPDVGLSEINLALSLAGEGRSNDALTHIDHASNTMERGLGLGHPQMAIALTDKGEILHQMGRNDEARDVFKQALEIWEREFGPENLTLSYALIGTGETYLADGNPGRALAPLEHAYRIRQSNEIEPRRRAEAAFDLAQALWPARRTRGRARALAQEAAGEYERATAKAKVLEVQDWLKHHGSSAGRSTIATRDH